MMPQLRVDVFDGEDSKFENKFESTMRDFYKEISNRIRNIRLFHSINKEFAYAANIYPKKHPKGENVVAILNKIWPGENFTLSTFSEGVFEFKGDNVSSLKIEFSWDIEQTGFGRVYIYTLLIDLILKHTDNQCSCVVQ